MNITLRDRILALNQEKIYSIYFDIPISSINWSTTSNLNKLHNPFRQDDNPSLSFKWFGNKLIVRDWGDSRYNGDIFKVIGYILNRNCFVDTQFVFICNDILDRYYNNSKKIDNEEYKIIERVQTITDIDIKPRILQKRDYNFYNSFGILNRTVDHFVEAVMRYSINGHITGYKNSYNDPCYKYTVNHKFTKLYFPYRHKKSIYPRFVTNNILQIDDITDIRRSNDKILVKSIKDKMLALQIMDKLSISPNDIAIHTASSETSNFHQNILNLLLTNTEYNIYAMYDSDNAGILNMNELEKNTPIKPLIFSTEAKDPTDFSKEFGYNKAVDNFKQIINQIHKNRNKL